MHTLDERVVSFSFAFGFKPFSPFFEIFNEKIGQLLANGWLQNSIPEEILSLKGKKMEDIGPQVLTMDHLEVGFIVCLIPQGVAFIVFLLEKVAHSIEMFYWKRK